MGPQRNKINFDFQKIVSKYAFLAISTSLTKLHWICNTQMVQIAIGAVGLVTMQHWYFSATSINGSYLTTWH